MTTPANTDLAGAVEIVRSHRNWLACERGLEEEVQAIDAVLTALASKEGDQGASVAESADVEERSASLDAAAYNAIFDPADEAGREAFDGGWMCGWMMAMHPDGWDDDAIEDFHRQDDSVARGEAWEAHREKFFSHLPLAALPSSHPGEAVAPTGAAGNLATDTIKSSDPEGAEVEAVALEPCPLCGGAEVYMAPDEVGSGGQWVYPVHAGCKGCGLDLIGDDCADATAKWNRRALSRRPAPVPEDVGAIVGEFDDLINLPWRSTADGEVPAVTDYRRRIYPAWVKIAKLITSQAQRLADKDIEFAALRAAHDSMRDRLVAAEAKITSLETQEAAISHFVNEIQRALGDGPDGSNLEVLGGAVVATITGLRGEVEAVQIERDIANTALTASCVETETAQADLAAMRERVERAEAILASFRDRCDAAVRPDDADGSAVTVRTEHLRRARSYFTQGGETS